VLDEGPDPPMRGALLMGISAGLLYRPSTSTFRISLPVHVLDECIHRSVGENYFGHLFRFAIRNNFVVGIHLLESRNLLLFSKFS